METMFQARRTNPRMAKKEKGSCGKLIASDDGKRICKKIGDSTSLSSAPNDIG